MDLSSLTNEQLLTAARAHRQKAHEHAEKREKSERTAARLQQAAAAQELARRASTFDEAVQAMRLTPEYTQEMVAVYLVCLRLATTPQHVKAIRDIGDAADIYSYDAGVSRHFCQVEKRIWQEELLKATTVKEIILAYFDSRLYTAFDNDECLDKKVAARCLQLATTAREVEFIYRYTEPEDITLTRAVLAKWQALDSQLVDVSRCCEAQKLFSNKEMRFKIRWPDTDGGFEWLRSQPDH